MILIFQKIWIFNYGTWPLKWWIKPLIDRHSNNDNQNLSTFSGLGLPGNLAAARRNKSGCGLGRDISESEEHTWKCTTSTIRHFWYWMKPVVLILETIFSTLVLVYVPRYQMYNTYEPRLLIWLFIYLTNLIDRYCRDRVSVATPYAFDNWSAFL